MANEIEIELPLEEWEVVHRIGWDVLGRFPLSERDVELFVHALRSIEKAIADSGDDIESEQTA